MEGRWDLHGARSRLLTQAERREIHGSATAGFVAQPGERISEISAIDECAVSGSRKHDDNFLDLEGGAR
jgi:hypothetical protein